MKSLLQILAVAGGIVAMTANSQAYKISLQPAHVLSKSAHAVAIVNGCAPVDAAVDGVPFFQMPAIAAEQGVGGTSIVMIELSSPGSLISASLDTSSGNPNLDRAALQSARLTRFTPEVRDCAAVGGSYLYKVSF